jgi:hypothetical protein
VQTFVFPVAPEINLSIEAPDDFPAMQGSQTVLRAANEMAGALGTLWAKEGLYGGAWRQQGWMGQLARIMSKTARLRAMLWADQDREDAQEPVRDTVQDLINLCALFLINRQERNRWGNSDA